MKKVISILLSIVILVSAINSVNFSVHAENTAESFSDYKFSYMSSEEAKAFIGFLLGENDLNEELWKTDIFYYLTGKLSSDLQKETEARIAFSKIASELLNARVSQYGQQTNIASTNLIVFLENRYGVNMDAELVNPFINNELNSIKEIIKEFVAIATDTELYELDAVEMIFNSTELIINRDKKIQEYTNCIKAIFDLTQFTTSAQQLDMYNQFTLYVSHAKYYLNFGESEITNMIIELSQDIYDLTNERSKWANCISKIVQAIDVFGLLDNYWLNWNTDERIALLKKWAAFIAYSQKASEEYVKPVMTKFSISQNTISKSDGTVINYNSRNYCIKNELTYQLEKTDLEYNVQNGNVNITKYVGYQGKYNYLSIPSMIDGYPVTKIEKYAFCDMSIGSVIIPETVSKIEDFAFYGCYNLKKIVILNNYVEFGVSVFDWKMGNADQTIEDIPIYCNINSTSSEFCEKNDGFYAASLKWNGSDIWGVAALDGKYHIHCGAELAYLSELVNSGMNLSGFKIVLENDIDMGLNPINPIGISNKLPYKGSFDGNGYSILQFSINNNKDYTGLFGYVISENTFFKDVNIIGSRKSAKSANMGGLIGLLYLPPNEDAFISGINVNIYDDTFSYGNRGGLIGSVKGNGNNDIFISDCSNLNITGSFDGWGGNTSGGIVGKIDFSETDSIEFKRCLNSKEVFGKATLGYSSCSSGGILGEGNNGRYAFDQCSIAGKIIHQGYYTQCGGLVGKLSPTSFDIRNCEMFANIQSVCSNGQSIAGGFIGNCSNKNMNDDGENCIIENSYVSAVISAWGKAAFINSTGELNETYAFVVKNCFLDKDKTVTNKPDDFISFCKAWDGQHSTSNKNYVNVLQCTSIELKNKKELYSNWDFNNIWVYSSSGYPVLRCFNSVEPCSEHFYNKKITASTCDSRGYTTYICNNCGYTYKSDYTSELGHKYIFTKTVAPTCTAQGYDLYTCSVCSSIEKRNTVKVLDHSYEFLSHKDSTCNTPGYDEYKCTVCSNIKKDEIAVLDGSALTASLEKAQTYLAKDYFTNESMAVLQNVYDSHINDLDTLTTQMAVDNAATEINTAINELVLGDYASGETDDGISWEWERCTGVLTVSGTGSISGYTSTTMPWYDVINYTTEIVVSDGITTIGKYAFYKAENVQRISLPGTLTTISERAFEYCSSIEELVVPDSVTSIGYGTFANMTNLKKVTVPASTTYRSYCFDNDKAIEEIKITYGVDGIIPVANVTAEQSYILDVFYKRTGSFGPWKYAENAVVKIESGVSEIGDQVFYYCSGIENIELPDTVTEIGTGNFVGADAATEITILNPNCTIQEGSFTSSNTIIGYLNSTAEVFANNNSIPFKAIDGHIHAYGEWTYNGDAEYVSSSDYKNGTQTRVCSVCGKEETIEAPNTALLRRRGNALALESSITLTTYITKDVVDYYDEVYAEFTRNGKTETVYASDKTFKSGSTVYNIFDYAGISPQAMGDDIEIKFYGIKDGVKYWGETYTYSVTTYVTSTLSKSTTSAKLKTMLVDLMYYGAACQIYQNYKTDSLMTNVLKDEQKKLRSTGELNLTNIKDSSYATCKNRLVRFGTALRLNNAVELAIPLNMTNVTLEELSFKVKIGSRDLTYTYSDNPENFEKGKDGYWYFYFDGVYANQMSDEVFITAYRGDEQVSYTLKYSVESYAATVTDSKLKKVTDAMMRYGNSAKAYSG